MRGGTLDACAGFKGRMSSSAERSEVELKLSIDPADVERLELHPLLRDGPKPRRLASTYFDTPDHRLRKAGLSLRIRSDEGRTLQTVKLVNGVAAGLFARGEWESELDASRPGRESLKDTPLETLLDPQGVAMLKPVFTVKVTRAQRLVETEDAEIELALDKGVIEAEGRTRPLFELELELKRGSPQALFALASRLFEAPPLRLSAQSKAEAGYALIKPARGPAKGQEALLTEAMTTAEALQAVGRACLSHFLHNEPSVRLERSPPALHQTRIALRRLRAAMSLFRPLVADEESQELKAEMRRLAGVLGQARDLDVFGERLDDDGAAHALVAAVQDRRASAYDRVVQALGSSHAARLPFHIAAWLDAGDWLTTDDVDLRALRDAPIRPFAAEVLARRCARVRKGGARLRKLAVEPRHQLRIEVKKLRYAAEFFTPLAAGAKGRKQAEAFVGALRPLQEALGELNDLATHQAMAGAIDAALAAEAADRAAHQEPHWLTKAETAALKFGKAKSFLAGG